MEDLAVFFKSILVHILVKTVDEFKGMNPKDVVDCIEGTPHISTALDDVWAEMARRR